GMRRQVNPRQPEEPNRKIPWRDVDRVAATKPEHQDRPGSDQRVANKKSPRGIAGEFEPMIAGAVAHQNSANSKKDTEVPKSAAGNEQQRMTQGGAAQARH